MPRQERPLEPDQGILVQFAADLRRLREQAGSPTYRQLSRRAHYSPAALSEAAGGKKLPSLAVVRAYVSACGGDVDAWEARWRTLAAELAAVPDIVDDSDDTTKVAPYVGLAVFEPGDANRFFGRDRLVADLLDRIRERRFVGVFGPSGSGKSSVLRAGVVASAMAGGLAGSGRPEPVLLFTPGPHPIAECAVQLAALTGESAAVLRGELTSDPENLGLRIRQALAGLTPKVDLLLVVDQFEEVFTLCRDADERILFIDALIRAAHASTSRARVVIGVRADFYGHCGQHANLVDALCDAQILVGPMTADELRQAITQPAVQAGFTVETALVARLIADANGQAGVLPLISHALLQTWRRRRGHTLTLGGYEATGGIHQAVARSAEHTYTTLGITQQAVARQLFLRLTTPGDGTEDTKRRIRLDELDLDNPDTASVLDRLAHARLIMVGDNSVGLAHEALIRSWPRLGDWLDEDRAGLRIHRHLTDATDAWLSLHREPGGLYRGARLTLAQDWANANQQALTPREHEFLQASLRAHTQEQFANRRRTRRLRRIIALLAVLLVVAASTTGYAIRAQQTATQQRNAALAQKVIQEATALRATNPALALQLALAASRLDPAVNGRLLGLAASPYFARLGGNVGFVSSLSISANGHVLAATTLSGTTKLWDVANIHNPQQTASLPNSATSAGISDDGRLLATTHGARTILWDLTDPRKPREITSIAVPANNDLSGLATLTIGPRRNLLITAGNGQPASLWGISDPKRPEHLTTIDESYGRAVEISPDGQTLATVSNTTTVRLWDLADPRQLAPVATLTGYTGTVTDVAFSSDGRKVATVGKDAPVHLWDISDRRSPVLAAVLSGYSGHEVIFNPDGHRMAAVGNTEVWVWDVTEPRRPSQITTVVGHGDGVHFIAFNPDGHTLVAANAGGNIWLEDLPSLPGAESVTFSSDGHTLITSGSGSVKWWDLMDRPHPRLSMSVSFDALNEDRHPRDRIQNAFVGPGGRILIGKTLSGVQLRDATDQRFQILATIPGDGFASALSPSGDLLALDSLSAGGTRREFVLFDISNPRHPREFGRLVLPEMRFQSIAFNASNDRMITADEEGVYRLWDIGNGKSPRGLTQWSVNATSGPLHRTLVFGPRGDIVATTSPDRTTRLWDIIDASNPRTIAELPAEAVLNGTWPIAFAPSGDRLATVSGGKNLQLWNIVDPRHPQEFATLAGHTGIVSAMAYSPDGDWIASTASRATARNATQDPGFEVRLWDLDIESLAANICQVAYPRIDHSGWNHYLPNLNYQPPCPQ